MTYAHIFYIPVILLVGLIAGYAWGRQAEQKAASLHEERGGGDRRSRRRARSDQED